MKIRFFGPIIRPDADALAEAEACDGTVDDLLSLLGYSADHRGHVVVMASGRRLHLEDRIPDEELDLLIMVPVGGG